MSNTNQHVDILSKCSK